MMVEQESSGIKKPKDIWLWIIGIAALASLADALLSVAGSGRVPERAFGATVIWSALFGGLWWRWRGRPGRYGALIGAGVGVAALVLIGGIGVALWARSPSGVVTRLAETVNQTVPRMIDAETRLDGAEVGKGGELVLRHSLIALPEGVEDVASIRDGLHGGDLSAAIIAHACGSESTRALADRGVRLVNLYSGPDGDSLGSVAIDSSVCLGQAR
jgi:hypothetical protein